MSERATTHWRDCWKQPGHGACAAARIQELERQVEVGNAHEVALWRARYMAAHEILLLVEQHLEAVELRANPAGRGPAASALPSYIAMRDAFLAYRASIEAGAPLAWAVLEQEVAG